MPDLARRTAGVITAIGLALAALAATGWQPARVPAHMPNASCGGKHDCGRYP